MLKIIVPMLLLAVVYVTNPQTWTFHWKLGLLDETGLPDTDLAGVRLYIKVGPCLNNLNKWTKAKDFLGAAVTSGTYQPPTHGTYCFKAKEFDTGGLLSIKASNMVQVN